MKQKIVLSALFLLLCIYQYLFSSNDKYSTNVSIPDNQYAADLNKLQLFLLEPNYRGWIITGTITEIKIFSNLNEIKKSLNQKVIKIEITLLKKPANDIVSLTSYDLNMINEIITCPVPDLIGNYDLHFRIVNNKKSALFTKIFSIEIKEKNFQPHIYIDRYNRFLVDGKPFFPIGMYFSGNKEDDLKIYSKSPFNCLLDYSINKGTLEKIKSKLDLVHQYGLFIIYSLKDIYEELKTYPGQIGPYKGETEIIKGLVNQFASSPSLFGWYISDELWLNRLNQAVDHHNIVHSIDSNHPTYTVLSKPDQVRNFIDSFDIIGTDPYPINRDTPDRAGKWTKITNEQVHNSRPLIQVLQVHNLQIYKKKKEFRPPTFDEINSMTWQSIVNCANGIIFYSFFDLKRDPEASFENRWSDLLKVAEVVKEFTPVILSTEKTISVLKKSPPNIEYMIKQYNGIHYIFIVNNSERFSHATFYINGKYSEALECISNTSIKYKNNSFTTGIEPLGVKIYSLSQ